MAAESSPLHRLISHIEEHQKKKLRNMWIEVILLAVLTFVTAAYTITIYNKTTTITPSQVASLAGAEIRNAIPDYKESFRQQLIDKAPSFIDRGKRMILNAPTQIRVEMDKHTEISLSELSLAFDDILGDVMTRSFNESWEEVEEKMSDEHYRRKVDYLLNEAQKDFRSEIQATFDVTYSSYASRLTTFKKNLGRLHDPATDLSSTEKIYKEILQIWAVICKKYGLID